LFKRVTTEQLKVPAHVDYLADLRDFITRVGRKHGFSDKIVNAFKLAIDEAGTNIIRHAYRGTSGFITIRAIVRKDSLTVALIDQGKYFDPRQVKDPDLGRYVSIGKKGGLGIFIIRKLMDDIDYHKTEEGNELRLTKKRDTPRHQRLKVPVGSIPVTLKAKYFLRISAVVTLVVALGYLYYFQRHGQRVLEEVLGQARQVTDLITSSLSQNDRVMADDSGLDWFPEVQTLYRRFRRDTDGMVERLLVVNRYGDIFVSSDTTDALWVKFVLPEGARKVAHDVARFRDSHGQQVYDLATELAAPDDPENVRTVHLQVDKGYVDQRVRAARMRDLRLAISILLLTYFGSAVLIYILMNPFRKLAEWVRALGQGEGSDEMDIDASTEIGEIAQAFTDITKRFRESQKNLAEQERLQKEMQVAQEIQQTLLPVGFPDIEGYEIASHYEAAKEVGGDYYDFVEVDKDTLGIAVADVSGKGVPGSLVMTMIRTALRTEARGMKDAAEVLARVNEFVVGDMKRGMFVTVFYVIIDSKNRRLNYASAGHNPMILYRPSTKKTYYLNPKGFPIGIQLAEKGLFRKSIESDTIRLREDDILLVYTDGITEAMNPNRELFGEERLLQLVREYGHLPVDEFVEKVREEIQSFTEGDVQYDDITLVAIKEKTSKEKEELRRAKEAHRLITAGRHIRDACKEAGITTYAYYSKYRRIFEEEGVHAYEVDEDTSVEAKHLSIEEKTKIFDIIRNHPEYGAKRISQELNTEKYGYTVIPESKIYEELVRSRLNTRQLREAFVARGGRMGRRLKPPGTPLLTLDGKVILDRERGLPPSRAEPRPPRRAEPPRPETGAPDRKETTLPQAGKPVYEADLDAQALVTPLEELLDKRRTSRTDVDEPAAEEAKDKALTSDEKESELPADVGEEGEILRQLLGGEPGTEGSEEEAPFDLGFEALFSVGSEPGGGKGVTEAAADVASETDAEAPGGGGQPPLQPDEAGEPEHLEADVTAAEGEEPFDILTTDDLIEAEILKTFEAEEKALESMPQELSAEPIDDDQADAAEAFLRSIMAEDEAEKPETKDAEVDEVVPLLDSGDEPEEEFHDEALAADEADLSGAPPQEDFVTLLSDTEDEETDLMPEPASENGGFVDEVEELLPAAMAPEEEIELAGASEVETGASEAEPPEERQEPARPEFDDREQMMVTALRYYTAGEYDQAIVEFQKVVLAYPDFKEAHSALGNAYFRKKMYAEAEAAYRQVKELDPGETTAYENLGAVYANRGDYGLAVIEWNKVLELAPERTDIVEKIERVQQLMEERHA